MQKLTLAEMAAEYKKTPKTFKKHVLALGIPHEELGAAWYFNPIEVSNYLRKVRTEEHSRVNVLPITKRKGRKIVSQKFAEA
jgi:spore germination cell wall hydrolase CwlJ-like protein